MNAASVATIADDPRVAQALGLPPTTTLAIPRDAAALAKTLKSRPCSANDPSMEGPQPWAWSSGQALHRETAHTSHVLCLTRLNSIDVDADRGVVHAESGALLVEVEAALRRHGWTLDMDFPQTLRIADGLGDRAGKRRGS